jgi:hypothetical protein
MSNIAAEAAKQMAKGGLQEIYRHMGAGLAKFNVGSLAPIRCRGAVASL